MTSLHIDQWTPEQVSIWIKGLGSQFEGYYQSFIDEEITGKALLTINSEYLKELSIENISDQNIVLEAVSCLQEVETCLRGETVHGQVIIVNEKTKVVIDQLQNEGNEGKNIETSESSLKMAGQVYQLAKKLLSWLIRTPFSEMNACWPLKDAVCRVVRDMTDETLLKNFGYLKENLEKLQASFDNFLNEKDMQDVFKQPPILKTEEITLEGEGLGIGITTAHNIHTVNSVATESPAGKNKNIRNGDEIVKVNGQCVIAWQQKNVITLMKSKPDTVSLTLKKLPLVNGPLNKPVDKPGTPLNEMEVIMDRTRITSERPPRVEMKESGIKEETSLEMQAIENEENLKIDDSIEEEPVEEHKEAEIKVDEKEAEKDVNVDGEKVEEIKKSKEPPDEEKKEEGGDKKEEIGEQVKTEEKGENVGVVSEVETVKVEEKVDENGEKDESKDGEIKVSVVTEAEVKNEMPKIIENLVTAEESQEKTPEKESPGEVTAEKESPAETAPVIETSTTEAPSKQTMEPEAPAVKVKKEAPKEPEKKDEIIEKKEVVVEAKVESNEEKQMISNGEATAADEKPKEDVVETKAKPDKKEEKPKAEESNTTWYDEDKTKPDQKQKKKAPDEPVVTKQTPVPQQNGETDQPAPTINVEPAKGSPDKKPIRPELPKMKIGNVKTVTVKGENTKQVELFSSNVVRREKKVNGAPNKRISCIELGEADCEGWLTKKSGGHGLTPTRWRRQWCVLKEEHMYYYKTSFDREAGGVFEITGYTVSEAPDIKKPYAFKCEKDGSKKYHFHADNEVDRGMWVQCLNAASRGERRQKEQLGRELTDGAERKAGASLKPQSRGRTSSVLAGIRFNYYDDDLPEDRPKIHDHSPTSSKPATEGIGKEQKDKENGPSDILKVSLPTEQNKEQQGTVEVPAGQKDTSDGSKSEPSEGDKGTAEVSDGSKSADVDKSGIVEQQATSETKEQEIKEVEVGKKELNESEVKQTEVTQKESDGVVSEGGTKGVSEEQSVTCGDNKLCEGLQATPLESDGQKDEFKEMAKAIQDADINIDGTERPSPESLLRKLSVNSKDEIMDKVVRLRLLKQNLKDKEHSMEVIDELLTSDVTPETIAEWRTKFDRIVTEHESSDHNENNTTEIEK